MNFLNEVERGMMGKNIGLPNGLNRANKALYGILKGMYYLIGAESGCGKTTFTDFIFLLSPYFEVILNPKDNRKIRWIYYSLEISKKDKMFTWMSFLLDKFFNIQLDRNNIKGIGPYKLSESEFEKVKELTSVLEEMFQYIDFKDDFTTPSMIHNDLMAYAKENGEFVYDNDGLVIDYIPHDEDLSTIIIIDHLALVSEEPRQSLKQAMDKTSLHMRWFRNKCNFTPVIIQQFNSEMGSIDRQKYKASALAPKREDFGDSRYTYRDADVVIGGIKPFDYDIPEYYGYEIFGPMGFKDAITFWHIIKNRYVGSKHIIPLTRGVVPKFEEVAPPNRNF